jgi:hypothetical protein
MTPSDDVAMWRNRFIAINLTRIGGTIIVLLGLLVWYSDTLVEGGTMAVGLPVALIGLAISFGGPIWLAKKWKTPSGQ